MGGSSKGGGDVTVGYWYYMGLHMAFCHGPVDRVEKIYIGGREAWSGTVTSNTRININKESLFGGEEKEGGIVGDVDILMGGATQTSNDYLAARLGSPLPAFRGVLSAVFRGGKISANNPYVKPWGFKVRRILQGWQGGSAWNSATATIGDDMNPAHIIYQCLTDSNWGMGYATSAIDNASFTAAAQKLFDEGFGLSLAWTRQTSIQDFIRTVIDHIGGVLYVAPQSGLFALKLIRDDYVKASLPLFDPSNLMAATDYQRQAWGETVNEVTVVFRDQATNKDSGVTAQDLANVTTQSAVVSQTRQYPGISNAALAQRVALRDLAAVSTPLAKIRLTANRKAWALMPGDVIRVNWPAYGIDDVVFRIVEVSRGTLQDGTINIDAVEDIYALPSNSYTSSQAGQWVSPETVPAIATARAAFEAPYWDLVRNLSQADFAYITALEGYAQTLAARPSGDSLSYDIQSRVGSNAFKKVGVGYFAPTALLSGAISPTATTLTFTGGVDLDLVELGSYAIIATGSTATAEYVQVVTLDAVAGTMTVNRGVLDTVPRSHSGGARIWFAEGFYGVDATEYASGEAVNIKVMPRTGLGTLSADLAPIDTLTMAQRQNRPYPPGNFRMNGVNFPASITGALTVAWAHRDRTLQTADMTTQAAGNIGPEAGTTYTLRLYDQNNNLRRTLTGLTGTSYTWDTEADDSLLTGDGTVLLLHFDGANGQTAATDALGNTVTMPANFTLTTAQQRFGTASAQNSTDYGAGIAITPASVLQPGSSDVTVEGWFRLTSTSIQSSAFSFNVFAGGNNQISFIVIDASRVVWEYRNAYSGLVNFSFPPNTWTHIALVRQGGTVRCFVGGVQIGADLAVSGALSTLDRFTVAGFSQNGSTPSGWLGQVDEFRYTIGTARYTANFTPPSAAFPDPVPQLNTSVRAELWSVRGGVESLQRQDWTTTRT